MKPVRKLLAAGSVVALCATMMVVAIPSDSSPRTGSTGRAAGMKLRLGRHYWAGEYIPILAAATPSTADRDTYVNIDVTIKDPAPEGGAKVNLSSNDPGQFSVWVSQVTIPANSKTGRATVRTNHFGSGSLVTITASGSGTSVTTKLQTLGSVIADP